MSDNLPPFLQFKRQPRVPFATGRRAERPESTVTGGIGTAAESARRQAEGFAGGQGGMTAPGTEFFKPPSVSINRPAAPPQGPGWWDDEGNVQPVGLHGTEEGTPTRPAMAIPNEQLSDGGLALVERYAADNGQERGGAPARPASPASLSPPSASRPRRVTITPEQARNAVEMLRGKSSKALPDERGELATTVTPQPTIPVPFMPDRAPGAFEPARVPMSSKVRAQPVAGEEEANDARVRDVLGATGGYNESSGPTATRERFTDPAGRLTKQIAHEQQNPSGDKDGWFKTMLKEGGRSLAQGEGLMGALFGAARGAIDPSVNEKRGQRQRVSRYQSDLAGLRAQEKERLALEDTRAGVRLKNEQANYWGQRPEADAAKRDERRLKDERARIFRVLSSLKGQQLDPRDSRVIQLQADADRADIPFDVESFNNSKGNMVRYTRTDPERPERTQEVERNVVTGEETVLGQKSFQATRGADGRTTAEIKTDEDRDRGFAAQQDHRRQMLRLSEERFNLALSNGLSAQASREFNVKTQGLQQRLNQIRTQINGYETKAKQYLIDPAAAERRINELETEAGKLLDELNDAKAETLGRMSSNAPSSVTPPAGGSSARLGRFAGQRMPRANLPAAAKALSLSESEAEAVITREGGTIY